MLIILIVIPCRRSNYDEDSGKGGGRSLKKKDGKSVGNDWKPDSRPSRSSGSKGLGKKHVFTKFT